ncbi:MAG TPA: HepT-like ribonuclease domain-containing protein [Thermoplasmata archaeon]|nr:HepT-like ribonuclease domain-containing protein [Thermoplasmata archaeon]
MKESDRTDAQKLDDMRASILRIETLTEDLDRSQFLADITVQEAVAFRVMAIGDAAGSISKRTQNATPHVDWKRISSFRYNPAHEYHDFRPENLWVFVQDVLPGLERKLRKVKPAPASAR